MTTLSVEQQIVEDFCYKYSNFMKSNEAHGEKKEKRKGVFESICATLFNEYQNYLQSIELTDFHDFKSLISKGLKLRRKKKEKEVTVVIMENKEQENHWHKDDDKSYWERMGFDQPLTMTNH